MDVAADVAKVHAQNVDKIHALDMFAMTMKRTLAKQTTAEAATVNGSENLEI